MTMAASRRSPRYVALFRAINLGSRRRIAMGDLKQPFEDRGCANVRTYVQSGNVVFAAPAACARAAAAEIPRCIAEEFGFPAPMILRSRRAFERVAEENPFPGDGIDPASLHVAFLHRAATPRRLDGLEADRSPGSELQVAPGRREIYLHLPDGVSGTRFGNAYLEKTLHTTSTMRNWRTVTKLLEMLRDADQ